MAAPCVKSERVRTLRADCQMRYGAGEAFSADTAIWTWLLRHAGWQISRFQVKANGSTAYKDAYGEHYTSQTVAFGEAVLARIARPSSRTLQGGRKWQKGDAVFIKGIWVGKSESADEHIILTERGRILARTIRRLAPAKRHNKRFLSLVRGLPWDPQDGIVRGRPKKEAAE